MVKCKQHYRCQEESVTAAGLCDGHDLLRQIDSWQVLLAKWGMRELGLTLPATQDTAISGVSFSFITTEHKRGNR